MSSLCLLLLDLLLDCLLLVDFPATTSWSGKLLKGARAALTASYRSEPAYA